MRRSLSILFWGIFFFLLTAFVGGGMALEKYRQTPVTADVVSDALVGPREPIVVRFSQALREASLTGKVTLEPAVETDIEWDDFGKSLVITPRSPWPVDTEYRLFIGQGRTELFARTPVFSSSFAGPRSPQVVSLTPADQSKDVVLGVEDPIRVTFDRSVKDFYIDFQFDPPVSVVYQHNPEKTEFEILPTIALEPGKSYTLSVESKWRGADDATYQKLATTLFTTLPLAPATLNRNLVERMAEAKRFTQAKQKTGKYIDINIATQVMTLFEDGQSVDAFIVSSGKRGMDTPRGTFAIHNQAPRPWSKKYSLYMPYWQAITPDGLYGIHELPEWPGGYKEGVNHLGTPVSHGCVRLGVGSAKRVYEWAAIGTPVVIY